MRNPVPNLDAPPRASDAAPNLSGVFDEIEHTEDPRALVSLIYANVLPAIAHAYREHAAETNPLVDYPTRRILRFARLSTFKTQTSCRSMG